MGPKAALGLVMNTRGVVGVLLSTAPPYKVVSAVSGSVRAQSVVMEILNYKAGAPRHGVAPWLEVGCQPLAV